ncbi:SdiA-regulated domain-containing protein [Zunongwangia sp. H14]|uniref:SdiA-regulated domain-containing protein n=1 Tax=Zunongwangia sp. H14 TaxID=3240792 RepID=UPI0035640287
MNKTAIWIIIGVMVLSGFLIFSFDRKGIFSEKKEYSYKVQLKWELPDILAEVSGIEWLENNRIACIQDEDGILFIYNLSTSKIDKEIKFAGPGDYEGITINGETAYVVRSDGNLFEVQNFKNTNPETFKIKTFLTEEQNVEGLCLDKSKNRLLLAIKDKEKDQDNYKGIYAFDLKKNVLANTPVFKLDMNDKLLENSEKKMSKKLRPSEIEIHPKTGEIYLLDAKNHQLIIMDNHGNFQKKYALNKDEFNQPEGLTFKPDGSLYISNEAGSDPANILEVELIK